MTVRVPSDSDARSARRRIHGQREYEILEATLDLLGEVGYDRMTLDAVATRARASKASLYRHFHGKSRLVVQALCATRPTPVEIDTGNLREDLLSAYCGSPDAADQRLLAALAGVTPAIARDAEFAAEFQRMFVSPRIRHTTDIYRRAEARGETRGDLDLELLAMVLAGLLLHRQLVQGEPPDAAFVERVVDGLILPAVEP